jgi:hypothetical protein
MRMLCREFYAEAFIPPSLGPIMIYSPPLVPTAEFLFPMILFHDTVNLAEVIPRNALLP